MKKEETRNPQDIQIQGVVDRHLRTKAAFDNPAAQTRHIDEDSLTAFAEGTLSRRETEPVVKHLVECSFCRHVTAELVKLDLAFASDDVVQATTNENQPSKISEVLNNLLSRIFGTNEGAVFAHEEKNEDAENQKKSKDEEDKN